MNIKSILIAACTCLAVVSFNANAVLVSRLGGLAFYDTEADLTWLADANYAKTSGFNTDGKMTWAEAMDWVDGLDIAGVTGWRLADTLQPDASCSLQEIHSYGTNCTGSEMGNLFYIVLGGTALIRISTTHNANYDLFSNIGLYYYWSATSTIYANALFAFGMHNGYQNYGDTAEKLYAWPVHSGDVGAVLIPADASNVEPDDFAAGTNIQNVWSGVTLSVEGRADAEVFSIDSYDVNLGRYMATTGTLVFGNTPVLSSALPTGQIWDEATYGLLRVDFDVKTDFVSIDLIYGDDGTGRLSAYDSDGNLLDSITKQGDG